MLDYFGDGLADLAVSAPGEGAVYVFSGASGYERAERVVAPEAEADDGFGHALAAAPLDGVTGDELLIGAPQRTAGGVPRAGAVFVVGRAFEGGAVELTAPEPRADEKLGTAIAAGDFDGDGADELAVGAPGGANAAGAKAGRVLVFEWEERAARSYANALDTAGGNFGHDLAVTDFDGDGTLDLVVSALGNDSADGRRLAGQVVCLLGPLEDGEVERVVLEDPDRSVEARPNQRWGMSIDARAGTVVVGSPRRDAQRTSDAGRGTVFAHGARARQLGAPRSRKNGLFGYRARLVDLVGDERPDVVFVALGARRAFVYAAEEPGKAVPLAAPEGATSHWAQGASHGQLVPGGKEELVLGSPRWGGGAGRVMILSLDRP